jgi:hypothetical protein
LSTNPDGPRPRDDSTDSYAGYPAAVAELRREQQASAIQRALNDPDNRVLRGNQADVLIYPDDDPARFDYFYLDATLTTRIEDADDVGRQLTDLLGSTDLWTAVDDRPIDGVTTFTVPKGADLLELCDQLDNRLRPGAVMPEHVIHVSPTSPCPATEPVPASGPPVPAATANWVAGAGVKIVVVDTGRRRDVEADHAWMGFITGDVETAASSGHYRGHGSFVAGVVRTMAPSAVIDVNALHFVAGAIVESDLAVQLVEALTQDAPQIISMSAGTTTRNGYPLITLAVACERLAQAEVLLVAAAGNDGNTEEFYPAYFSVGHPAAGVAPNPFVVSVGAITADETLAVYSNHDWPSVYARGSQVVNGYPRGQYDYQEAPMAGRHAHFDDGMASWDGTSFATPLVAGLIAAHMSRRQENAQAAWEHLRVKSVAQNGNLVGPVLRPGDADLGM